MDQGFLEAVELPGGKTTKLPTSAGNEIGLLTEERMGMYGTYTVVKYSAAAQTFIFDHMEAIMAHHEQFKAAQKEAKAAAKAQKEAARADTPSVPPPPTHFQSSFLDRPWTATHDERLRSMFMAGATVSDMAGAIKRTEAGIRTRLQELGLQ